MATLDQLMPCPSCGRDNDRTSNAFATRLPRPGDVTVCVGCRALGVITEASTGALTLRAPTDAELVAFSRDPRLAQLQQALSTGRQDYGDRR